MSALERKAKEQWLGFAAFIKFGICQQCSADTLVAKQPRAKHFLCLDCFDDGDFEARRAAREHRQAEAMARLDAHELTVMAEVVGVLR